MSSAIGMLRGEHEQILRGADVALVVAQRLERGERVPAGSLSALLLFFAYVLHRKHRDKEESLLFPRLREKGVHDGPGCVGILLDEHSETFHAFERMTETAEAYEHGERSATSPWAQSTRLYVDSLRRHIRHEEDILFPNAQRLLTEADDRELVAEFSNIDARAHRAGLDEVIEDFERIAQAVTK